ncbi:hypothetical protein V6N13_015916 [Hibiscus sabdariffa]
MGSLKMLMMLLLLIESTIFTESSHGSKQKKADGYGDNVFNVISFGAIGDGTTDDSKGFKQAWDVACNSSAAASSPTVLVPQGKAFLLQPLTFNGKSCSTSNHITFQALLSFGLITSAVEISNVRYEDIKGTSGRRIAVQLSCSESTPCTDIIMKDISLRNKDQNGDASSICLNAHGFTISRVEPNLPCLQKHDSNL